MKALTLGATKAPLVLALPIGGVCMTRRIIKLKGDPDDWKLIIQDGVYPDLEQAMFLHRATQEVAVRKPHHRVGDKCFIAVPHWAWVEIVGLKAERLQQCTEADAVLELVERTKFQRMSGEYWWRRYWSSTGLPLESLAACWDARESYATMINAVDGPGTWESDPWVWAITARRIERPEEGKP